MSEIKTVSDFCKAVQNNESLSFDADGHIEERDELTKIARRIFGFEYNDTLEIAKYFSNYLISLEIRNSLFKTEFSTNESLPKIKEAINVIKERAKSFLKEERAKRKELDERKKVLKTASKSRVVKCELDLVRNELLKQSEPFHRSISHLKNLYTSLKYRTKPTNQIVDTSNERWLINKVKHLKFGNFPDKNEDLTSEEISKIKDICRYPEMIKLMKHDHHIRNNIFSFIFFNALRGCKGSVDIAFQFPTIQMKLTENLLDKRVCRLANEGLKFHEEKDVTLLFEGKEISIVDEERQVSFKNGKKISIREVFNTFAMKSKVNTDLEYLQDGITLCHPFDPKIDFQKAMWFHDLPIFEIITKEELENRNKISLNSYALLTVKVSRSYPDLRINDNHAWLQIAIPQEDEKFKILPIGKYADIYPVGLLEKLFYIFQTHHAAFNCVDENEFYLHREQKSFPLQINADEFAILMEKIRNDLVATKEGNLVFQAQGDNCSAWVQEVLDEVFKEREIPRLFDIKILDTIAPFPAREALSCFNFIRDNISETAANTCRVMVGILFGAWTGIPIKDLSGNTVVKRLLDHEHWQKGYVSIPSVFFKSLLM